MDRVIIKDTIVVSPELGKFLEDNRNNITEVIHTDISTNMKIWGCYGLEIRNILDTYHFSSGAQVMAYLLSSQNFTVKEKRYQIKLLEAGNDSYVNRNIETGYLFISTPAKVWWHQTIFTQKEIDANPALKQFEKWKTEVD